MRGQPSIIRAIHSPKLFGALPRFKKLSTWAAWLVVLKSVFGLPFSGDELAIFQRHTGRKFPPLGGSKETYLIIGRRGGKSFISALIAVFVACFGDFRQYITIGETLAVMCLAKDKDQARIVFRYIKAILNFVPALKAMIVAPRADEIELSNGVTIMVKTSDFGGVRGPTIVCVVADEIAFWPSQGVNPDNEVLTAIRPGMATIPDAKLLCISTGYAMTSALFDAHKEHFGKNDDEVLVWQADTRAMNPTISQEFIDKEIARDPEAGRAEWLGLFREDISAAFPLDVIEACIIPGRVQLPASQNCAHVAFTDPSGGRGDYWATAVAHAHGEKIILDAVHSTKPPFSPADTAKQHAEFLKSYGIAGIVGDAYAGEFPRELFAKNGISYSVAEKHKSDLYLELIPLLTSRRAELLDHEKLKTELRRLERRRGRSGKDSIDHPPRGSDDIANAVAGPGFAGAARQAQGAQNHPQARLSTRLKGGTMPKKEPTASEQISAQIDAERKRSGELETQVTAVAEKLAALKSDYEHAVEAGESESQLDQRDEAIIRAERELARAQIKLAQCKNEIESLERQHDAAVKAEWEHAFMKAFDDLLDRFISFEMAFTEFQNRKAEIEEVVRSFTNQAQAAGHDTHRLRISDQLRRQVIERLWPGYASKHSPEAYRVPLADILESHCRSALGIQRPANGKTGQIEEQISTEERT